MTEQTHRSIDPAPEQTARLLDGVRHVLGADLLGAYPHGSSVLDGLRPDSDIDVVVVSARRTTVDEKRRLIDLLLSISGGALSARPGRPIELDIVVASEIRPWRYPPAFDFHYDELLRDRFERGSVAPWTSSVNPDLASAVTMVLLGDEPLAGPRPADLFDPVPRGDYIHALLAYLASVDEYLPGDTRNVVLTLPRIWSAIATDEVHSKESAADWALPRLPEEHRAVLQLARAAYLGETEDRWEDRVQAVRAYADFVIAEIERSRAEQGTRDPRPGKAPDEFRPRPRS